MKGGFDAWNGLASKAEVDQGIYLFEGNETPEQLLSLAYGLEAGNQKFYKNLSQTTEDEEVKKLFSMLAGMEDEHKERIWKRHQTTAKMPIDRESFETNVVTGVLEDGKTADAVLDHFSSMRQHPTDAMELAMSLETDALDLYLRMAHRTENEETEKIFFELSEEERLHLQKLAEMFRKKISI
jgi:rubrerythrin